MKKILLAIVCLLFSSGYVSADVFHPEDASIRGHIGDYGDDVCFNNDGSTDAANCPLPVNPNEGYVYTDGTHWRGDSLDTSINGCGVIAVDPVSSAVCPNTITTFATCTPNQFVLVQTINSGHYFAIKAGNTCGQFNRPENQVIFPCLSTDAFDPVTGCSAAAPLPDRIGVEQGYIRMDTVSGAPNPQDCSDPAHYGRMVADPSGYQLYICADDGWRSTPLAP